MVGTMDLIQAPPPHGPLSLSTQKTAIQRLSWAFLGWHIKIITYDPLLSTSPQIVQNHLPIPSYEEHS